MCRVKKLKVVRYVVWDVDAEEAPAILTPGQHDVPERYEVNQHGGQTQDHNGEAT